ncbi:MAG: LytTR family DNA-binding domain-containing protein [Flavobacteriaceae bacterium]|nr:LytTR family DNA-binding domain-containing protein [Flavobacteriaceae bacterium]
MNINCVIIDDEILAIQIIEKYLEEFQNIEILGSFTNPIDALQTLEEKKVDVIFMDINMSKMNGLEFLRSMENYPHIIITTAYREYAVESYDLDVLDYLVKPIPFHRFLKSINKLIQRLQLEQGHTQEQVENKNSYFFVKVEKKLVKIRFEDILYIESLKDYIKMFTTTGDFLVHKSLTGITEELPSQYFLRLHRCYTVAIDKIASVEGNTVEIGSKRIPIGRKYINHAKGIILKNLSV